jgi:acetate kinase
MFPNAPNVAVFDTAFHQTMPPEAYLYAIPYKLYTDHSIRRYGFHGTSHHFVALATAKMLNTTIDKLKLITCHIGNGCSITAINNGNVVDTSMGLTPLEGLVMGTRSGDVDPAIIFKLMDIGMSPKEIDKCLNKESGLLGVSGVSSDMRDIINAGNDGNERASRALKMFARRIIKYTGAYYALLGGADALVFTGGIGEYSIPVRELVVKGLSGMGLNLDKDANDACFGKQAVISKDSSSWKAIVMPTNEELMIAQQTLKVIK